MRYALYLFFLLALMACKRNSSPTCIIIAPTEGQSIEKGSTLFVSVDASDNDGFITEVRIYLNDMGVQAIKEFPFNFEVSTSDYVAGEYTLKAVAKDNEGAEDIDYVRIQIAEPSSVYDYEGNAYEMIAIGEQVWMAENLRSTKYSNGTPIEIMEDQTQWDEAAPTAKYYCWYENNESLGEIYGALYTWAAAMNGAPGSDAIPSGVQGVCPDGWHLPSDEEFMVLERTLGMTEEEMNDNMYRGTVEGGMLKEQGTSYWSTPNAGATNETGFSGLPGGARDSAGVFYNNGFAAYFWLASGGDIMATFRSLVADRSTIESNGNFNNWGYSVRCVRDD